MDIHQAYHAVALENQRILQITVDIEKAETPEVKQAYETIKGVHVARLTTLHADLVRLMSTMVASLPEPPK